MGVSVPKKNDIDKRVYFLNEMSMLLIANVLFYFVSLYVCMYSTKPAYVRAPLSLHGYLLTSP